jgi:hypothetical protein
MSPASRPCGFRHSVGALTSQCEKDSHSPAAWSASAVPCASRTPVRMNGRRLPSLPWPRTSRPLSGPLPTWQRSSRGPAIELLAGCSPRYRPSPPLSLSPVASLSLSTVAARPSRRSPRVPSRRSSHSTIARCRGCLAARRRAVPSPSSRCPVACRFAACRRPLGRSRAGSLALSSLPVRGGRLIDGWSALAHPGAFKACAAVDQRSAEFVPSGWSLGVSLTMSAQLGLSRHLAMRRRGCLATTETSLVAVRRTLTYSDRRSDRSRHSSGYLDHLDQPAPIRAPRPHRLVIFQIQDARNRRPTPGACSAPPRLCTFRHHIARSRRR